MPRMSRTQPIVWRLVKMYRLSLTKMLRVVDRTDAVDDVERARDQQQRRCEYRSTNASHCRSFRWGLSWRKPISVGARHRSAARCEQAVERCSPAESRARWRGRSPARAGQHDPPNSALRALGDVDERLRVLLARSCRAAARRSRAAAALVCRACWFQRAIIPATSGAAALVPPTNAMLCAREPVQPWTPLEQTIG